MIANMNVISYPFRRATPGFSDSARFVDKQSKESRKHLQPFFSYGRRSDLFSELDSVAEEISQPGWNGNNEEPVSQESYYKAYCLAEMLPLELPNPTVGADPDGELTFEWYRAPHRLLSLSIGADGFIHYVARIGPNKHHGREEFFDEMPKRLVELAQGVVTG